MVARCCSLDTRRLQKASALTGPPPFRLARPPRAGEAEAQTARAAELESELAAARELAGRLEEDLLKAEGAASASALAAATAGEAGAAGAGGAGGAAGGGGEAGTSGAQWEPMVAVLSSQRDRFRARVQEAEAQLAALGGELTKVRPWLLECWPLWEGRPGRYAATLQSRAPAAAPAACRPAAPAAPAAPSP